MAGKSTLRAGPRKRIALGLALALPLCAVALVRPSLLPRDDVTPAHDERELSQAARALHGALAGRSLLILVTDALRADSMTSYGNPRATTPALDQLAARGLLFERAFAQTAWTLPSVASLFTGLEQEQHGVQHVDGRFDPARGETLAELFRERGYRTTALVQNGVLWPGTGLDRGFERYELFRWTLDGYAELLEALRAELDGGKRTETAPRFVYAHVVPPHAPYVAPPPFAGSLAPRRDREGRAWSGSIDELLELSAEQPRAGDERVELVRARYEELLRFADQSLGMVLGDLARRGESEHWAIVHTSDHGEAFFEHGKHGHGSQLYPQSIQVPLVLAAPGSTLPVGLRCPDPVQTLELVPTLIELFDLRAPRQALVGRSLLPALCGEPLEPRALHFSSRIPPSGTPEQLALLFDGWLWIEGARGASELFDLGSDPGARFDRAASEPAVARELERQLDRWRAERDRPAQRGAPPAPPERRAALEALGYLGEGG